jgi:cobalt/nickel transport system permease protein
MSGSHLPPRYAPRAPTDGGVDSPIHRVRASVKLAAALGFVVGLALVPVSHSTWTVAALPFVLGLALVARVPIGAFAARVAIAEPFVLGVAVLSLFQGGGLAIFTAVVLKSTACVAAVQLLTYTTPFHEVLAVLRRARVPAVLVHTLALLYRYLFVLVEESHRMQRARAARTWEMRRWGTWKAHASVMAVSFVRGVARAEKIYAAMVARGWS